MNLPKPNTESKTFLGVSVKDADRGEVEAVIATLNVVDRDGDIIRADAVPDGAKVAMSSYGHDAVWGARPAGKGTLTVDSAQLRFSGRAFLNTAAGRETFETLKEMGPDQQWSFGYRVLGWEIPSDDEKKQGAVRILTKLDAFEVSPVLIGAGIDTTTLGVKSDEAGPKCPPVTEQEAVQHLAEVKAREKLQAEVKEQVRQAVAREFETFQRTLKRHGVT